jgi:hypothetical protein
VTTQPITPIGRGRYAGPAGGPDPLIRRFGLLFQGRLDAVGGDDGRAIYEPYTYRAVAAHLTGENPIGVYPSYPDQNGDRWTRWGCCDIDTGDWQEAFQLATALGGMGLQPHVERSRSKGWHIWVFVPEPVPAATMRRCLKVAYAAIDLPAKEANPKSEVLAPNQLGNYVRQPFKGALNDDQEGSFRQRMMGGWDSRHDGQPYGWREWMESVAMHPDVYSDPERVAYWASKWYEPKRKSASFDPADIPPDVSSLVDRLDKGWRDKYTNGEARDRSETIVALAHWCARRGWLPADVYALLWWSPWNKYRDRQDGERYVMDIVDRVFT